jgi:hypothetical protein
MQRVSPAVRFLFEQTPVLWFESRQAYDVLLSALFDEYEPLLPTEAILVKDLADCHWESTRLQRIKRAAVTLKVPAAGWKLLSLTLQKQTSGTGFIGSRKDIDEMMHGIVNGSPTSQQLLKKVQDLGNVSDEVLLYEAYTSGLTTLNAIDASLSRLERRRTALLRLMEQRKKTNAALNNAYLEGMFTHAPTRSRGTGDSERND